MLVDYLPILILFALALVFGGASLLVAERVAPRNPTFAKSSPYECGIDPERLPRDRFPVRFALIGMLFIIFDVEVMFFYPWAAIAREVGLFGLGAIALFTLLLGIVFLYEWRVGGLDWEEEPPPARLEASRRLLAGARAAGLAHAGARPPQEPPGPAGGAGQKGTP